MSRRQSLEVLHVNNVDLRGRRYNGFDLLTDLLPRGISGRQAVIDKLSKDPRVFSLLRGPRDVEFQRVLERAEARLAINNLLYPWGRVLAKSRAFQTADVVHYHVVHNKVVSLFDMPQLFRQKPSVWTFHDPWPLTGHCIHPLDSDGWLTGCDPCPFLDRTFPLARDNANQMWRIKRRVLANAAIDVVVASPFMLDMVRRSPLTSHLERVHVVPFGVDTEQFTPHREKALSRRRLALGADDFIVLLRATGWAVKGLAYAIDALEKWTPSRPTTILTVDGEKMLEKLRGKYRVVELGWVDDKDIYPLVFNACDVFLMPSLAEGFGMMALEAMASGRPVICFRGTSVETLTRAPGCGMAVPFGDAVGLAQALDAIAADSSEAERRGAAGREIAVASYTKDRYLDALAALYRQVASTTSGSRRWTADAGSRAPC